MKVPVSFPARLSLFSLFCPPLRLLSLSLSLSPAFSNFHYSYKTHTPLTAHAPLSLSFSLSLSLSLSPSVRLVALYHSIFLRSPVGCCDGPLWRRVKDRWSRHLNSH